MHIAAWRSFLNDDLKFDHKLWTKVLIDFKDLKKLKKLTKIWKTMMTSALFFNLCKL